MTTITITVWSQFSTLVLLKSLSPSLSPTPSLVVVVLVGVSIAADGIAADDVAADAVVAVTGNVYAVSSMKSLAVVLLYILFLPLSWWKLLSIVAYSIPPSSILVGVIIYTAATVPSPLTLSSPCHHHRYLTISSWISMASRTSITGFALLPVVL